MEKRCLDKSCSGVLEWDRIPGGQNVRVCPVCRRMVTYVLDRDDQGRASLRPALPDFFFPIYR